MLQQVIEFIKTLNEQLIKVQFWSKAVRFETLMCSTGITRKRAKAHSQLCNRKLQLLLKKKLISPLNGIILPHVKEFINIKMSLLKD